jgi:class 3 adenylate cyclase
MAQRMAPVAAAGGAMLSASTARLADGAAAVGEAELVRIKGTDEPVAARRLLGMCVRQRAALRTESNLAGRRWNMPAVEGLLDHAIDPSTAH